MTEISSEVIHFFNKEHFVIIATLDKSGTIHTSAKGILEIGDRGKIFILDLYKGRTYQNIKNNPNVNLTLVDERRFMGYSIKGKARIVREGLISKKRLELWHDKLAKRIARRVIRHVKSPGTGSEGIPEAGFPMPKYLIEVSADKVISLTPGRLKKGR